MTRPLVEDSPQIVALVGALEERERQMRAASPPNFGDANMLWQCRGALQAMRLELAALRSLQAEPPPPQLERERIEHQFEPEELGRISEAIRTAPNIRAEIPVVDALGMLGIIQFAARNPSLSPQQKALVETFGRDLQAALVARVPALAQMAEAGWWAEYDRPREAG